MGVGLSRRGEASGGERHAQEAVQCARVAGCGFISTEMRTLHVPPVSDTTDLTPSPKHMLRLNNTTSDSAPGFSGPDVKPVETLQTAR